MKLIISNISNSPATTGISTNPRIKERLIELAKDNYTSISRLIPK